MINSKYSKIVARISLKSTDTSSKFLLKSFKELIPSKNSKFRFMISIFLALLFGTYISFSPNTVSICEKIIPSVLNTYLVLFTCALTVYTLSLNFFSKQPLILYTYNVSDAGESKLSEYIEYFEHILFLYFAEVFISFIVSLGVSVMNEHFIIQHISLFWNNILCTIFLSTYLFFVIRLVLELQSLVFNTLSLTRNNICMQLYNIGKEENNEDINTKK